MKKINFMAYLSLALLSVLLLNCAGRQAKGEDPITVEEVAIIDKCTYPHNPEEDAPLWVCGAAIEGLALHAVGVAEGSQAGFAFVRQLAAADARTLLAQELRVEVANMVKSFAETTGRGETETLDQVNSVVTKQITSETLEGARIIRYQTSSDGTLYVLVGMDEDGVRSNARRAVSSSYNDDNAAWQQFRAQQSQEELAKGISGQPVGPQEPAE